MMDIAERAADLRDQTFLVLMYGFGWFLYAVAFPFWLVGKAVRWVWTARERR